MGCGQNKTFKDVILGFGRLWSAFFFWFCDLCLNHTTGTGRLICWLFSWFSQLVVCFGKCQKMSISFPQNPRGRPQMSYFSHNTKIFSLLLKRSKETRKYSHSRRSNQRFWTVFFAEKIQTDKLIIKIVAMQFNSGQLTD